MSDTRDRAALARAALNLRYAMDHHQPFARVDVAQVLLELERLDAIDRVVPNRPEQGPASSGEVERVRLHHQPSAPVDADLERRVRAVEQRLGLAPRGSSEGEQG